MQIPRTKPAESGQSEGISLLADVSRRGLSLIAHPSAGTLFVKIDVVPIAPVHEVAQQIADGIFNGSTGDPGFVGVGARCNNTGTNEFNLGCFGLDWLAVHSLYASRNQCPEAGASAAPYAQVVRDEKSFYPRRLRRDEVSAATQR